MRFSPSIEAARRKLKRRLEERTRKKGQVAMRMGIAWMSGIDERCKLDQTAGFDGKFGGYFAKSDEILDRSARLCSEGDSGRQEVTAAAISSDTN